MSSVTRFLKEICEGTGRVNPYLRYLESGMLRATTGERTLAAARNIFKADIDPDFKSWGNPSRPTKKRVFEVSELINDGQLRQIFEGFGVNFDEISWSEDQVIAFAEDYRYLLHPQYTTFFLVKTRSKIEYFVAGVRWCVGEQLGARAFRLLDDTLWDARNLGRFMIPQQE